MVLIRYLVRSMLGAIEKVSFLRTSLKSLKFQLSPSLKFHEVQISLKKAYQIRMKKKYRSFVRHALVQSEYFMMLQNRIPLKGSCRNISISSRFVSFSLSFPKELAINQRNSTENIKSFLFFLFFANVTIGRNH